MVKEKIQKVKNEVKMLGVRASLMAAGLSSVMYTNVYATSTGGDLGELLKTDISGIVDRSINAVAAIIAMGALIKGALAVKDMAESQGEGNPEQRDRGQNSLKVAIGAAVAAALLLGIKVTIVRYISAAMG